MEDKCLRIRRVNSDTVFGHSKGGAPLQYLLYQAGWKLVACTDSTATQMSQKLLVPIAGAINCLSRIPIKSANAAALDVGYHQQFVNEYISYLRDWTTTHSPWLKGVIISGIFHQEPTEYRRNEQTLFAPSLMVTELNHALSEFCVSNPVVEGVLPFFSDMSSFRPNRELSAGRRTTFMNDGIYLYFDDCVHKFEKC